MEDEIDYIEILREKLKEKYGLINFTQKINRDFKINMMKRLESFYIKLESIDEDKRGTFINNTKKKYTDSFEVLFNLKNFESFKLSEDTSSKFESLEDILNTFKLNDKTIKSFINGNSVKIDNKSRDYYCIALGKYISYKNFQEMVLNEKKPYQDNLEEILITKNDETVNAKLEISGALLIDDDFVEKIKNGQNFSELEFYISKLDNACQWFGVFNNYDVERSYHKEITTIVKNSFSAKKGLKVEAIIGGTGGCGKSTLLRRIAHDLHKENFKIVWLLDSYFNDFVENGFVEIEKNNSTNYVVFIEDWYRIINDNKKLANHFLNRSTQIENIRIVIADRVIEGTLYEKYLSNKNNKFVLNTSENKAIIDRIVEKVPQWKTTKEVLFTEGRNYESSLFLLIFIIARVNENNENYKNLDLNEPQVAFQSIINNDLKYIKKFNKGIAKAMHYWACVYSSYRIFISYSTFLKLADFYNGDTTASKQFTNWNLKSKVLEKIKIYFTLNNIFSDYSSKQFIQFNHDILADLGLSKTKLKSWDDYYTEDLVKKDMLDIITNYGDDISASLFLSRMITNEKSLFNDKTQILSYIKKLISQKNEHYSYLFCLIKLDLTQIELEILVDLILEARIFPFFFFDVFLKKYKGEKKQNFIAQLLKIDNIDKYNQTLIRVLKFADQNEALRFCNEAILMLSKKSTEELTIFNVSFFQIILKNSDNQELKNELYDSVLHFINDNYKSNKNYVLPEITAIALRHSINDDEKRLFSEKVLQDKNWKDVETAILCNALECVNDETKQSFSNKVLQDKNWKDVETAILCNVLQYANNEIRQSFSNNLVKDKNWKNVDKEIFCRALEYANDESKNNFSKTVLKTIKNEKIDFRIICKTLRIVKDKETALYFLKDWKNYNWNIIFNALLCYENTNELPNEVEKVIQEIISNNDDSNYTQKDKKFKYINLLIIPLFGSNQWKISTEKEILNWKGHYRIIIKNILISYRKFPRKIEIVCLEILQNWETEITEPIRYINGKDYFGGHILIALGHPNLRNEAIKVASQICNSTNDIIPGYLKKVALKIKEENEFPQW